MTERQWYYAQGSKQEGPVTEQALSTMLTTRQLPMTTLVWSEHLSAWTPASSVDPFAHSAAPPPPMNKSAPAFETKPIPRPAGAPRYSEDGYSTEPRPWHRFLARFIDNIAYSLPETIVMMILIGLFNMVAPIPKTQISLAITVANFFVLPIPILLEPTLLALLGGTPGKLLLNIRVRNADGSKLTWLQAMQRTGAVWLRGGPLAAFIPLIGFLVCIGLEIFQYQQLTSTGSTSWDRNQNLTYEHGEIGAGRIAGIVATGIFAGVWFIGLIVMIVMFAKG